MLYSENPQLKLAYEFVNFTDRNIFLTGKAGTGKTTFLHSLRNNSCKRMIVIAPTGVAAINAGGVTIHSFFQMPFGPHIPERAKSVGVEINTSPQFASDNHKKINRTKINLIKCLDLLVIDEISMVRADLLDGIDEVLRKYRDRTKPFGGVQLLMIGDLHQLSPVVKEEEWNILKNYYETMYFFGSLALQKTQMISIELRHIYRQSDAYFIEMLNQVRNNKITPQLLKELNSRFIPNFKPSDQEGYIILTTHNINAQKINQSKLNEIRHSSRIFTAIVSGDFPEYSYPTEMELELKKGAQVMFVKNDISRDKLYYNGKIGKITRFEDDIIYVKCPMDASEIPVGHAEWSNNKYALDEKTKEITETIVGSYTQYPLKLAWAITIHKSQGLTFEKAIIDANASFAHGQVYVALSRCKSFEGLVLSSPIMNNSIKTDITISDYSEEVNRNVPTPQQLKESKISFQQSLLKELFDFKKIKHRFYQLKKIITENSNSIETSAINDIKNIEPITENEIYSIADKFNQQLEKLLLSDILLEENMELQERIKKASIWFIEKMEKGIYNFTQNLMIETDNKAIKKSVNESLENLQKEIFIKLSGLKSGINGFISNTYLQIKANADIDYKASIKTQTHEKISIPKNSSHPELYKELKKWRENKVAEKDVPVFMVLPQKTLLNLVKQLPISLLELETVSGMGKTKIKQYGNEIISIISSYCEENNIEKPQYEIVHKPQKEKLNKSDTKKLSFDKFKEGKTIEEIARERELSVTTIEGHLAHYVGIGELDISAFVSKEKVATISDYFSHNKTTSLNEAKLTLGNHFSYSELKFVIKYHAFLKAKKNY